MLCEGGTMAITVLRCALAQRRQRCSAEEGMHQVPGRASHFQLNSIADARLSSQLPRMQYLHMLDAEVFRQPERFGTVFGCRCVFG